MLKELRKLILKIDPPQPPKCTFRKGESHQGFVECCYFCKFLYNCIEKVRKNDKNIACPIHKRRGTTVCPTLFKEIEEERR